MPTDRPAGAQSTAEAAELRKAHPDRPQSKARRGPWAGEVNGVGCGRTAEELWKLSAPFSSSLPVDPAGPLALVHVAMPENRREVAPPIPPHRRGAALVLRLAEPTKVDGPPHAVACVVLTHPAFNRPAVVNPQRRGTMGAITLRWVRLERESRARRAELMALRDCPPHDLLPELLQAVPMRAGGDRAAGLAADAAVIGEALARLDARLRRPGEVLDSPANVRAFVALHLAACDREEFWVMFLTNQHALIAFELMSLGTLSQAAVYPREVARRALALNAAAVVLAHSVARHRMRLMCPEPLCGAPGRRPRFPLDRPPCSTHKRAWCQLPPSKVPMSTDGCVEDRAPQAARRRACGADRAMTTAMPATSSARHRHATQACASAPWWPQARTGSTRPASCAR